MSAGDTDEFPWSLLGIAPTDDPAAIRAAYAQRLRGMQPDRDPDAFQALRAARDHALVLAAGAEPERRPHPVPPAPATDQPPPAEPGQGGDRDDPAADGDQIAEVMASLEAFLDAPWSRSDAHSWGHFLRELPILGPRELAVVERAIAERIDAWLDEETLPAAAVLLAANDRFGWDRNDSRLPYFLDPLHVTRLRAAIASLGD